MTRAAWDAAIEDYFAEHDTRRHRRRRPRPGPADRALAPRSRARRPGRSARPSHDPAGHHDWVIEAEVDLDASDELGELVLATTAMRRL